MSDTSPRLRKRGSGFTQVPNQLINDNRISFRAKGIWALIESKPDNWVFRESNLVGASTEGRDAFRAAAKELIAFGWLHRFQERNSQGHFVTIYELLYSPLTEKPSTVKPSTESQASYKDQDSKTDKSPQSPQGPCGWESNSGFMKVMEAYSKLNPSRVSPAKAWVVWQQEKLDASAEQILLALPTFAALDQWKRDGGRYIPNFAKWLADGAWRTTKVSLQVSAEELEERRRITSAGLSALSRIKSCEAFGTEPEAEDLAALRKYQALQVQ
ncbi:hypothetical protein [Agrobacterium tumefaciens]|uniref:Helix-turn-helix domain-containing protein n=1 Tax=Agrobacterium tumefaciens TaxID=358 RepID=A0A176WW90_AGRTU|nr:hypothetical protein [Agrobacterium tumefaciens]OAE37663.1 hypothetical protein A7J57_08785 [Agrobacterium tumefaciens]